MRGARLVLSSLAGFALLAAVADSAEATTPTPPATTTPASAAGAGDPAPGSSTTVAGGAAPATTAVPSGPTVPRAGSAIGDLDRRADDETWSVRRIATATLLGIAALAIVGHVYGRIQSISPRVGRAITRAPR